MTQAFVILKRESERVPGKNWRLLEGRPLYQWILDTLAELPTVDRVLIDTDAPELVTALPDARFHVHRRAAALCGHEITANALLAAHLPDRGGEPWLMVHATSPFLRAATLARALTRFALGDVDSLFGATCHRARFWREDGTPLNHDPALLVPTQALAPLYEEDSSLYLFTPDSFWRTGSRLGQRPAPFAVPRLEALDIDTEEDRDLVAAIARAHRQPAA